VPPGAPPAVLRCVEAQSHPLDGVVDRQLLVQCSDALEGRGPVEVDVAVRNRDRALGAMLSGQIALRYGNEGLPEGSITVRATGSAGQSFGAFGARGLSLSLRGEANDYVGKGLSGAVLSVAPPEGSTFRAEAQVIVGNTVLYGATSGRAFFAGRAGERFACATAAPWPWWRASATTGAST
jgi:glutamate synthase (NADPH/NADH) large chain